MSRFTTEERHRIYKMAKTIYEKRKAMDVLTGMCYCVRKGTLLEFGDDADNALAHFPELWEIENADYNKFYWWPIEDRQIRLENFDKLIEITKPK